MEPKYLNRLPIISSQVSRILAQQQHVMGNIGRKILYSQVTYSHQLSTTFLYSVRFSFQLPVSVTCSRNRLQAWQSELTFPSLGPSRVEVQLGSSITEPNELGQGSVRQARSAWEDVAHKSTIP